MPETTHASGTPFLICVLMILGAALMAVYLSQYDTRANDEDVYYSYVEGRRITNLENPYVRVLSGDMRRNQKYATYFPGFYLLSAASQLAGLDDYEDWITFWRVIFVLFEIAIALLIFHQLRRPRGYEMLALFACAFWLFNRWTVHTVLIAHIEFMPIFFLLLSLVLMPRRPRTALLLFGVSLALKQIAIFLVPLYLVWIWREADRQERFWKTTTAVALIAAVPLLVSLPFMLWNLEGFVKSVLFSATRNPTAHVRAQSVDAVLQIPSLAGRLPMLLLMAAVYVTALRCRIGIFFSSVLVMYTFVCFNSALFVQYFTWIVPLLLLSLLDLSAVVPKLPTDEIPDLQ